MKTTMSAVAACLLLGCSSVPPSEQPVTKRIELFLVGGQSNADGHGHTKELTPEQAKPYSDVLFYHGNGGGLSPLTANTWLPLQPGSGSKKRNTGEFGPELSFGKAMHQAIGSDAVQVAVIKYAVGGSNLASQWHADGTANSEMDGPFYQNFQNTVTEGIYKLKRRYPEAEIHIAGMLWHQGESDTSEKRAPHYEANLSRFIRDIRMTFGEELVFVIGQISQQQFKKTKQGISQVMKAQKRVADTTELNGLVSTQNIPVDLPNNRIHFGTEGQLLLGELYSQEMLRILGQ